MPVFHVGDGRQTPHHHAFNSAWQRANICPEKTDVSLLGTADLPAVLVGPVKRYVDGEVIFDQIYRILKGLHAFWDH